MMQHNQATTVASASTNGLLTLFGAMTLNEWATFIGLLCGIGTFAVNWYYKRREDRRRERGE